MKSPNRKMLLFLFCILGVACQTSTPVRDIRHYSIEQFYKNKQIGGGEFSPDGRSLLIHSNETGIYNLFEISIADGKQRPLTHSTTESFFTVDYVPNGDILYLSDKGGNERNHLYLLKREGTTRDLTPGQTEVASFLGWNIDRTTFFYLSNKRNPKFFDLYEMDTSDWKSILVYQNEAGYQIGDISWDRQWIALQQNITTSENRLFIYNLASRSLMEISDPATPALYNPSGFSRDGKSVYYITDAGKEFQYLAEYNIENAERKTIFETKWNVMYSYTSEKETYRVIGINEDGRNVLKVLDVHTGAEIPMPKVPDGDVLSVSISQDEQQMRLSVGTSKAPTNLYVYNFSSKELKKLTNTLNTKINPDDLVAAEVVRYKSFDGLDIPAIYYKPLQATSENKVPALVWVHGGPGGQSRVGYFALIQYLVNHGYAILAVNNRGSSGYGSTFSKMDDRNHGDKDLKDCIYGKKYLQSLEYIDKDHIGIIGGSYGGFMTMAAMTFQPEEFAVGVNLFGVTNWLRTLRSIPPYWESFRKALYAEVGNPATDDSVRLYDISPLFHAQKIKHPVMVLQGANDPRVLQVESDEIVAAMRKNGVQTEYVVFPDEGHGFRKTENEIKGYGAILKFLDKYLKKPAGNKPV